MTTTESNISYLSDKFPIDVASLSAFSLLQAQELYILPSYLCSCTPYLLYLLMLYNPFCFKALPNVFSILQIQVIFREAPQQASLSLRFQTQHESPPNGLFSSGYNSSTI